MLYPKINSLYKREQKDGKFKGRLIMGEYTCPEFRTIKYWSVTEKIDGTNIRITYDGTKVEYGGRSDNALIPSGLLNYLMANITLDKFKEHFPEASYVVLCGEGVGPKINGGGHYGHDPFFVLFDVVVGGWWLHRRDVLEIAWKFDLYNAPLIYLGYEPEVPAVPYYGSTIESIVAFVAKNPISYLSKTGAVMEGIVARAEPVLHFRAGGPIMFKLLCEDFNQEGKEYVRKKEVDSGSTASIEQREAA
jgi:hypothetical protein